MLACQPSLDEILHRADKVMVLEDGQVKSVWPAGGVSGEAALCTRGCRKSNSSILKSYAGYHPLLLHRFGAGDQHRGNKLNQPLQSNTCVFVYRRRMSRWYYSQPQQTSIRNVLRAKWRIVMTMITAGGSPA